MCILVVVLGVRWRGEEIWNDDINNIVSGPRNGGFYKSSSGESVSENQLHISILQLQNVGVLVRH